MSRVLLTYFLLLTAFYVTGQSPTVAPRKIKSVEKKPQSYEYPTEKPASKNNKEIEKPWVVYSARSNNITYTDKSLSSPLAKVQFLDSFYVAKETDVALELIKYNPSNLTSINKINSEDNVEYIGWVSRANLLLNDKSFLDASSLRPTKYVTVLNGSEIFSSLKSYSNGDKIKLYSDPELVRELPKKTCLFNEIVYVYKNHEGRSLIGKQASFQTGSAGAVMLGWIPSDFIASWGIGLCVEPHSVEEDTIHQFLFPSTKHAYNFSTQQSSAVPLQKGACGYNPPWPGLPVFGTSRMTIQNRPYNVLHTGTVLNAFENSNAYIFNIKGNKIHYSDLCNMINNRAKTNIVFALNSGEDTRAYLPIFLNTLQELDTYLKSNMDGENFRYGFYDCSKPGNNQKQFHTSFSKILPELTSVSKNSVEFKRQASASGIMDGLNGIADYFTGHEEETNIVVMISTKGDDGYIENSYKTRKLAETLASKNVRLMFYQPYSSSEDKYEAFISQSKSLLVKTAEKADPAKEELMVGNIRQRNYPNSFRSIETGASNLYCLDYPENSNHQGFLVFPTVGNKTDADYLLRAFDNLISQIKSENNQVIESVSKVFNSPGVFNSKPNAIFTSYFGGNNSLPANMENKFRNINHNFFAKGVAIYPSDTIKYFKQSLLLSEEEYLDMLITFKSMRLDLLSNNLSAANQKTCYNSMVKTMKKTLPGNKDDFYNNLKLSTFIYKAFGYSSTNTSLKSLKPSHLASASIPKHQFKKVFEELNARLDKFYAIHNNEQFIHRSNGVTYYKITEDYLP
ncbi:type VI secretion system protein TssR [Cytophagaceae bacterium ABcell3]|nr:type VI secretion system protein TssR [Cytophagaceae bacterium ABcell3]